MNVGSLCQKEIDRIDPERPVRDAAERMLQRGVGTLIVEKGRRPIGIVTDRDLTVRVLAPGRDPIATTVADVMTSQPATVRDTATIDEALAIMRRQPCRRLPVVDGNGMVIGIVALDDILMHIAHQFSFIGEILENETPSEVATS